MTSFQEKHSRCLCSCVSQSFQDLPILKEGGISLEYPPHPLSSIEQDRGIIDIWLNIIPVRLLTWLLDKTEAKPCPESGIILHQGPELHEVSFPPELYVLASVFKVEW